MNWRIHPSPIEGSLEVPGDKSIAHRALMLASLAQGRSLIANLPSGEDVRATAACMRSLGARIDVDGTLVTVESGGRLSEPGSPLYAANSGTTMRLLTGILAGQEFPARLTGDASLSRRPMRRIIDPLTRMGAVIQSDDGRAPLDIQGGDLHGIDYTLPVASAQVKSAVLLAGLFAAGRTSVAEPLSTRDHTERLLRATGVDVHSVNGTASMAGEQRPRSFALHVPGDISSAAFFFAAAALTGGTVEVRDVGINPTRAFFLEVLHRMGSRVEIGDEREEMGEPVATVRVGGRAARPVDIAPEDVPLLVDELPLVALLATQADGTSTIRGAAELRVKETDRIAAVARALESMAADVEELPDGFIVRGPTTLRGSPVGSEGDHRVAMMLAVAGAAAQGQTTVLDAEAAAVSFPRFATAFAALGGRINAN